MNATTPTPRELLARRDQLRALAREIDIEITAVEGALAMYGARRSGRPRVETLMSDEDALAGHRQYLRNRRRLTRLRESGAS